MKELSSGVDYYWFFVVKSLMSYLFFEIRLLAFFKVSIFKV
jgi:hypothetical protein